MEARIEMPSKHLIPLNGAHSEKLGARWVRAPGGKTKIIFRVHN
jgi:hypothetical protein